MCVLKLLLASHHKPPVLLCKQADGFIDTDNNFKPALVEQVPNVICLLHIITHFHCLLFVTDQVRQGCTLKSIKNVESSWMTKQFNKDKKRSSSVLCCS